MTDSKPSDGIKSSPTSVWLIWSGPTDARYVLAAATTEDAANMAIGRRITGAEGAPVINPQLEEVVVIGDPDPKSVEAMMGRFSEAAEKIGSLIGSKLGGPDGPFRHL